MLMLKGRLLEVRLDLREELAHAGIVPSREPAVIGRDTAPSRTTSTCDWHRRHSEQNPVVTALMFSPEIRTCHGGEIHP